MKTILNEATDKKTGYKGLCSYIKREHYAVISNLGVLTQKLDKALVQFVPGSSEQHKAGGVSDKHPGAETSTVALPLPLPLPLPPPLVQETSTMESAIAEKVVPTLTPHPRSSKKEKNC